MSNASQSPKISYRLSRMEEATIERVINMRDTFMVIVRCENSGIHTLDEPLYQLTKCHVVDNGGARKPKKGDRGIVIFPTPDNFSYGYYFGKILNPYTLYPYRGSERVPVDASMSFVGNKGSSFYVGDNNDNAHIKGGKSLLELNNVGASLATSKWKLELIGGNASLYQKRTGRGLFFDNDNVILRVNSDIDINSDQGTLRFHSKNMRLEQPGGWIKATADRVEIKSSELTLSSGVFKIRAISATAFGASVNSPAFDISVIEGNAQIIVASGDITFGTLSPDGEVFQYVGPDPKAALVDYSMSADGFFVNTSSGDINFYVGGSVNRSGHIELNTSKVKLGYAVNALTEGALTIDSDQAELLHKKKTSIVGGKSRLASIELEEGGMATLKAENDSRDAQPALLGQDAVDFLKDLIDEIKKITVPTGVGPSATPINSAAFDSLKNDIDDILSEGFFHN